MSNVSLAQEFGFHRSQVIFEAGTNNYFIYRIASLVATKKGTLLAFCSARKGGGGDWAPIDIVMRRSVDSGKTWEPQKLLVKKRKLPCDNATPIIDYITDEVHLLYQVDYSRCYYMKSIDDGLTWSEPEDITKTIDAFKEIYPWVVQAPGPGHGIQLNNGRIIVPFWLSNGGSSEHGPNKRGHRPSIVVSVYSDDHGKTWKAGDLAVPDNNISVIPNETSCVELSDGRVLFNSRNESPNYRRLLTYSKDGVTNWSIPKFSDSLFEPICFGSMCRYSLKPFQSKNRVLFCNPDSRNNPWKAKKPDTPRSARARYRENLTIRMSYDEGETWPISKVIDSGTSGYSDIAVSPDGLIHVFYEGGTIKGTQSFYKNKHMSIVSFDLEWLTNGRDKLSGTDKPLNDFFTN